MKYLYTLFFLSFFITAQTQVPPNDKVADALNITDLPFIDYDVQTQNATPASNGTANGCNLGNNSRIYYRFKPTSDVSLKTIITNGNSSSFVIVYESSVDFATSDAQLTLVTNSSCSYMEEQTLDLLADQVYYIAISNPSYSTNTLFIDVSNLPSGIVTIPDVNFKNALINHTNPVIDTNNDGEIQMSEAFVADNITVWSKNISDLTGIEAFVNLITLNSNTNNLTNIDVSQNILLKELNCDYNSLTSLDISHNILLEELRCIENELTSLDLSQNTLLESLRCWRNQLTNFDISNNLFLETLNCSSNNFSVIDVTQNTALKTLYCWGLNLTTIDVTQNVNLEFLDVGINNLSNIDISQNINLTEFWCILNQLTDIDVSSNIALEEFYCYNNDLSNIDIIQNGLLKILSCSNNPLTSLDVSQNALLKELGCSNNQLTSIDVSQNTLLEQLSCKSNQLTSIDVSENLLLEELSFGGGETQISDIDITNNSHLWSLKINDAPIVNLDVSLNTELRHFDIRGLLISSIDLSNNNELLYLNIRRNDFLESINYKNGNNTIFNNSDVNFTTNSGTNWTYTTFFSMENNPNLNFICVDDVSYATSTFVNVPSNSTFVDDCTNIDSANTLEGTIKYDENNNGCDTNDISPNNVLVTSTDGITNYGTFINSDGEYTLNLLENTYTTQLENLPDYFTSTPETLMTTFTGFDNTETSDFCLTANQSINDLNIVLLPTIQARPGFDVSYKLVYENVGTTILSGEVVLEFDDSMQSFIDAIPSEDNSTSNSLTFNYSNLEPFETRTIELNMNTFTPPTVNDGDILNFTATISPTSGDNTIDDNTYILEQVVVNSFDPNDKQVLQGNEITLDQSTDYLDYLVRFQNTGSASAINVRITDELHEKLDWNTIKPISSSHDYRTEIVNGNFVQFIFENINLPSEQVDEPASHGFIAFKIKPKSDVIIGDVFTGEAKIYFDFNLPIITNEVTTEIISTLSVNENNLDSFISVYPNPLKDYISIKSTQEIIINSVKFYDVTGKLLMNDNSGTTRNFNLNKFTSGIYFMEISTDKGTINKRIIKE